jgi:hypothetical protein
MRNMIIILMAVLIITGCGANKGQQRATLATSYNEAMAHFNAGHYHKALDIFADLREQRPDNVKYQEYYALALLRTGQRRPAHKIFSDLVTRFPNRELPWLGLAESTDPKTNPNDYTYALEKVISINANNLKAHELLARFYLQNNNNLEADKHLNTLLRLDPGNKWAQMALKRSVEQKADNNDLIGLNNDGKLSGKELQYLHKHLTLEDKFPFASLPGQQEILAKTALSRRDFWHYLDAVFRMFTKNENYHAFFSDTESGIQDLKMDDPDYSKLMYFMARNLSFATEKDNIMPNRVVTEKEANSLMNKLKDQVLL